MANAVDDQTESSLRKPIPNPYDDLIEACENDAVKIQAHYEAHRTNRNRQQRTNMLDPAFSGLSIDLVLHQLYGRAATQNFVDPRHCLVFWARPPAKIRDLIQSIQVELVRTAPRLWLMPIENLHMTALEISHSKSVEEISRLEEQLESAIPSIVNHTFSHRARLVKPTISYDNSAVALSFVPAADIPGHTGRDSLDDSYTYHHLRRDLYQICSRTGVPVNSRYVVPSAHLTIARFIAADEFSDEQNHESTSTVGSKKMQEWIEKLEKINRRLQSDLWSPKEDGLVADGGEWIVGQEKGLDYRSGTLWYGGGKTLQLGRGF